MTTTTTELIFPLYDILSAPENKRAWGWELEGSWGIVGLPRTVDGEKPGKGEYTTYGTDDFSSVVSLSFDEEHGNLTFAVTHLDDSVDDSVDDELNDERWRCFGGSLALWTGSNALPVKGAFTFADAEHLAVKSFVYQGTVFYAALSGYED